MIATPRQGKVIPPGATWCADNGCFGRGYPGDEQWFAWLASFTPEQIARCAFAVAPDVVADAAATLERSLPWLPRIRALGYPAAFVAQDGQEHLTVPWDAFDVLFVGGSTEWKLGSHARAFVIEAKARGKYVHMGRVNSERRIRYAVAIGCDSVDGTYLTFGPDVLLPDVLAWLRGVTTQPTLEAAP
ncbi:MAG TPA: hypothetical protein VFR23_25290 [Jiangellaceae bacterium]|nr:hypothetical protein [Jiangellaceae bacterium]